MSRRASIVVVSTLAVLGMALAPAGGGIPDVIGSKSAERSEPVWRAAERAVQGGDLAWELFTPYERSNHQGAIARYAEARAKGRVGSADDPCDGAGEVFADYYVPDPSLEDIFSYSEVVFSGVVQGKREGFYLDSVSSLYAVHVDRVWKDSSVIGPGQTVFVSFPQASIRVGGAWRCSRSDRFPDEPLPGKRILVFSDRGPHPYAARPIFSPMKEEIFFETESSVSVPGHLHEELGSSRLSDIEETVSKLEGRR